MPTLRQGGLWTQDLQKSTLDDILKQMFDGYEAGSIPRDKIPDDDALKAVLGDLGEQWCDDYIVRRYRPGLIRSLGRVGEKTAGVIGRPKIGIEMPPGSGRFRFPDGIDDGARILVEVKNRKEVSLTTQLSDYIDYCLDNNYTFEFWVRGPNSADTTISTPLFNRLNELQSRGLLERKYILNTSQ